MKCGHCGLTIESGRNHPCEICGDPMHSDCRAYHIKDSHMGVGGGRYTIVH